MTAEAPLAETVEPLDPASPQGVEAARALTELLADVDERLRLETAQQAVSQVTA